MIYLTVPVTSRSVLINFLSKQLSESLYSAVSSDLGDGKVDAHKDLVFASQQALRQFEEAQKCPGS